MIEGKWVDDMLFKSGSEVRFPGFDAWHKSDPTRLRESNRFPKARGRSEGTFVTAARKAYHGINTLVLNFLHHRALMGARRIVSPDDHTRQKHFNPAFTKRLRLELSCCCGVYTHFRLATNLPTEQLAGTER